jgi:cobalt-precorrin 5A hydrolase
VGARVHIFAFTSRGLALARRLASLLADQGDDASVEKPARLSEGVASSFMQGQVLVFIGALGIAVRAVAPLLQGKDRDPAVIGVDEAGEFVIPLLSGHLGGANRHARRLARLLGATPVITTATDVNGVFAFDAFAEACGYAVLNPPAIKAVAAEMLAGRAVGLKSDLTVVGGLPDLVEMPGEQGVGGASRKPGEVGVYIGIDAASQPFKQTLRLAPRAVHVGVGSRRGVAPTSLASFFEWALGSAGVSAMAVASIASIDLKRDEPAILALARRHSIPFTTFAASELAEVSGRFGRSERVLAATGVGNVCESAAYLSAKRAAGIIPSQDDPSGEVRMLMPKQSRDGMTLAIALAPRRVSFAEYWEVENCV